MARILSGETLKSKIRNSELIEQGKENNCKGLKYDLVLSGRYLKAKIGDPAEYNEIPIIQRRDLAVIKPGEVVFVITEEIFNLPQNYYAQLTPKRRMGELGINVNGALFVDPKYYGKLVFGLYNFSSEDFLLQPGKTFASAVIYELEEHEEFEYEPGKYPKQIMDFSPELINMISKCEPIGITELSRVVQNALKDISSLKQQADVTDTWKKDVQRLIESISQENNQTSRNISELQKSIESLRIGVEAETQARKIAISEIDKKVSKRLITLQTLGYFITTVLIGGGGTLFIGWLIGLINF